MRDPLTRTLLILTFVTGIVDVVSFLALGNVFAAMQTGNVIFLGLGVVGEHGAPVVAPLVALVAFLVGGTVAALLARAGTYAAGNRLRLAMAAEIGLLGGAAVLAAIVDVHPGGLTAYVLIATLSVAMDSATRSRGGSAIRTSPPPSSTSRSARSCRPPRPASPRRVS